MTSNSLWSKYFHIFCIVSLYWVVSIVTVFVNKTVLSSETVNLDAPLFITWTQCVVSTVICFVTSKLSKIFPNHVSFPHGNPLSTEVIVKMLPLSILFTAMISFNNVCLKLVGVAFYYIGRSLTTVFNVLLTYLFLGQKTSRKAIFCCLLIIFGFFLGVDQENVSGSFSLWGTIFGVLGSLTLSMYSVHTKKLLPFVKNEVWLLSYYNNFYSVFIFIPIIIITGEIPKLRNYEQFDSINFWLLLLIGGLCGFSIGFVTSLQIKVTSPLTHNVSGTAKACAQTVIATYWYNEVKPFLWWTSNFIVLLGSAGYTRVQQLEMKSEHENKKVSDTIKEDQVSLLESERNSKSNLI